MGKTTLPVTKIRPFCGTLLFIIGLFMFLALWDYKPQLSYFYRVTSQECNSVQGNRLGIIGVGFAFYTCRYLGYCAWLLPIYALWTALLFLMGYSYNVCYRHIVFFVLALMVTPTTFAFLEFIKWFDPCYTFYSSGIGGCLGNYLFGHFFEKISVFSSLYEYVPSNFFKYASIESFFVI